MSKSIFDKSIDNYREDNGWIPCKKKKPEDLLIDTKRKTIDLLVCTKNGKVTKVQRIKHYWNLNEKDMYWYWSRLSDVIAWQPLPEKYVERGK